MVNDARSSSSNYHPCSQKRKISIGVMAESPNKPESAGVKDGQATEKAGLGLTKQFKALEQRSLPWISTRQFENSPIFVDLTKQPSNIEADANSNGFIAEARTLEVHSVRICSKSSPSKQYQSIKVKKIDKENAERSKGTSEITERPSVARRALAERRNEENKTPRTENTTTNALKLRLRELLGTVSSQKENREERESHDTGKITKKVKQRHNSDTIESDSEAVDNDRTPKRPVTRMLSRKILSSKKGEDSTSKEKETFSYKQNKAGKNLSGKSINPSIVKGSSLLFDMKKREEGKNTYTTRFAESGSAAKNVKSPAKSTESFLEEISFPLLNKEGRVELKKVDEQKNIQSPAREEIDKLTFSKNSPLPEQERLNEKADFESPTFGFEASFRSAFRNSPSSPEDNESGSHVLPKGKLFGDASPPTASPLFKPNRSTQSSDETEEPLSTGKSVHSGQEVEAGNTLQELSEGSRNSENSKDDSPIVRLKGHTAIRTSCQFSIFEKQNFMLRPTEKISRREGPKFDDIGTPSPSKDNEEHRGLHMHLEQDKEDGLNRIVVLFSSALERFEVKMKAVASRKILEILKSVSEGICTQLQSVESQIQADVTNMMSSSKLKRKRLEARYEEQQEIMRQIQQKYKDDITQHFRNCRNTLEGLEAHQSEFKKIVERQRASHRKLLAQVEEAIQTHLSEGDRRITTIHARVSKQMRQLKQMIVECLKDSLFN